MVDKEKPLLDEDIEVKHMKRLEQVRARHPYHAISEDQSDLSHRYVALDLSLLRKDPKNVEGSSLSDLSLPRLGMTKRRVKVRFCLARPRPETQWKCRFTTILALDKVRFSPPRP
ncbi:hypothetical protein JHK85_045786 [Glycine max]|nr:hypothetical protein JHK85_045786 [Glycine max]